MPAAPSVTADAAVPLGNKGNSAKAEAAPTAAAKPSLKTWVHSLFQVRSRSLLDRSLERPFWERLHLRRPHRASPHRGHLRPSCDVEALHRASSQRVK